MSGRPARPRRRLALKISAALAAMASLVTVLQFAGLGPLGRPPEDAPPTTWPTPTASTAPLGSATTLLVPAVGGMLEAQAGVILRTAGFHVRVQYASAVDGSRVGRVLAQAPAAGSPLSRGEVVAIVVGTADAG